MEIVIKPQHVHVVREVAFIHDGKSRSVDFCINEQGEVVINATLEASLLDVPCVEVEILGSQIDKS